MKAYIIPILTTVVLVGCGGGSSDSSTVKDEQILQSVPTLPEMLSPPLREEKVPEPIYGNAIPKMQQVEPSLDYPKPALAVNRVPEPVYGRDTPEILQLTPKLDYPEPSLPAQVTPEPKYGSETPRTIEEISHCSNGNQVYGNNPVSNPVYGNQPSGIENNFIYRINAKGSTMYSSNSCNGLTDLLSDSEVYNFMYGDMGWEYDTQGTTQPRYKSSVKMVFDDKELVSIKAYYPSSIRYGETVKTVEYVIGDDYLTFRTEGCESGSFLSDTGGGPDGGLSCRSPYSLAKIPLASRFEDYVSLIDLPKNGIPSWWLQFRPSVSVVQVVNALVPNTHINNLIESTKYAEFIRKPESSVMFLRDDWSEIEFDVNALLGNPEQGWWKRFGWDGRQGQHW
ncbi:hypothetical protein [Vibrio comitans]|uniref:Lipoprotein n=1 Tax=Vibrio comitans NBRC 102076 TaxID=1219078 RepID=A0A4Y3ITA5_9VIBR|nr:hypothetical protein [Vibrio comitans]GEA62124.1 hypothetical protein VCO01S_33170 [Vibrio comitans NBRC 102076]